MRTREIGLADAGRTDDTNIVVLGDPDPFGQGEHEGAIEAPVVPEVHVFDDGPVAKLGSGEEALALPVLALFDLSVDEQPETVLEREYLVVGVGPLVLQGHRHDLELELDQRLDGRVVQHGWWGSFHR